MDIKVSGRKTTVTDALRARVEEKVGEACKVFDIEPMTVDVVLRYEKNPSNPTPAIVEVTVRARGSVIRVAEHGTDMYSAIDIASDKVTRQLRKFKTKVVDNRQQGPSAADVAPVKPVEDLADLAAGVFVAPAVDEDHIGLIQPYQADLGRALNVIAALGNGGKFVHGSSSGGESVWKTPLRGGGALTTGFSRAALMRWG